MNKKVKYVTYIKYKDNKNTNFSIENEVPVVETELVILDDNRDTCEGLIKCINEWKSFIDPEDDFSNVGDIRIGKNWSKGVFEFWKPIKALLVSKTEIIEKGDKFLYENQILTCNYVGRIILSKELGDENELLIGKCKKIIVSDNDFTPQQLQMLIDKKIKEGDKVLV
jgi:hypothetical protein